jgi:hypothetical protein
MWNAESLLHCGLTWPNEAIGHKAEAWPMSLAPTNGALGLNGNKNS